MALGRFWCATCKTIIVGIASEACIAVGHRIRQVGVDANVDVVVTDRTLDLDTNKFGYLNMVGHAIGNPDAVDHERVTRERIEQMRTADQATKREHRINLKARDNPRRVGAIPSALLFSLKRQYGNDYVQKAKELMKRENLWWGD